MQQHAARNCLGASLPMPLEPSESYYRARYYDPGTGRFVAEDPLRFRDSFNFFRYVGNSPSTFIDPLGLCHVEMRYNELGGAKLFSHTYLLVNGPDTNGHSFYFRGGPEHGVGSSGSGGGNLIGTTGVYGPSTADWDKNGTDLPEVLLDDGKPCACIVGKLAGFTDRVNAAGIAYDKETTNSNAFSYGAARAAGLNPGPPIISAPGYDTNLPLP
jgi:hypothetical protein